MGLCLTQFLYPAPIHLLGPALGPAWSTPKISFPFTSVLYLVMVQGEDCVLRESGDCFHWLIIKIIFKIAPRIVA